MRFVRRIPPTDQELSTKLVTDAWSKIKEPNNLLTATLTSVPFIIINGLFSMLIIIQFYNPLINISGNYSFSVTMNILDIIFFIMSTFILIIVHELIHMIFIPDFMKSDKIYWGITLNGGFVATTEKISKRRFIMISIMPYFLLSIVLPIILGVCNILNSFIVFLIIVNAMASSVDILNLFLILCQTPVILSTMDLKHIINRRSCYEKGFILLGRLILTELINAFDKSEASRYKAWADFLPEPYAGIEKAPAQ